MANDPVQQLLEQVERPVQPSPEFSEALLRRLLAELEERPVVEPARARERWWTQKRALVPALALVALAAAVVAVVALQPPKASALSVIKQARMQFAEVPPFRAVVVRRFNARSAGEPREIAYRSATAWRVSFRRSHSFWVYDGRFLGRYNRPGRRFYLTPGNEVRAHRWDRSIIGELDPHLSYWPGENGTRTPPESYFRTRCSVLSGDRFAGRPARHLSCAGEHGRDVEIWLDADYGLILQLRGPNGYTLEVRQIEVDPAFAPNEFKVSPPAAAEVIWNGLGNAPPKFRVRAGELVSGTIDVGQRPAQIVAGAGSIWVANLGGGSISRIDPATNSVTATIRLAAKQIENEDFGGSKPMRSASSVAFGAGTVWVGDELAGTLERIDSATNKLVGQPLKIGAFPAQVSFGKGAVWFMSGPTRPRTIGKTTVEEGSVLRLKPKTGRVEREIRVDGHPWLGGIAAGEGAVWATVLRFDPHRRPQNRFVLVRIDPGSNRVAATVELAAGGRAPTIVGAPAVGEGAVWLPTAVGEAGPADLLRINPRTNSVVARIPIGTSAARVGFAGGSVWVTDPRDNTLTRIDARTNAVVGVPIRTGGGSTGVVGAYGALWVTNNRDGTVARIDLKNLP
jgi:YVTN family beta-propeller protein